jgi:hypothetical protein
MSINGISGGYTQRPLSSPTTFPSTVRDSGVRPKDAPGVSQSATLPAPAKSNGLTAAPGASATLPAEAPAGTDPALWSVLTSAERSYFAKSQASGPLTYGRVMAERSAQPTLPAVRGGRLDIRG